MGSDADMEDYGFEYSDEEPEEQDVDIENQYYNSKGMVETDPEAVLSGFAEVFKMILKELHKCYRKEDWTDDQKKGPSF